jgi:hypothetical protein
LSIIIDPLIGVNLIGDNTLIISILPIFPRNSVPARRWARLIEMAISSIPETYYGSYPEGWILVLLALSSTPYLA